MGGAPGSHTIKIPTVNAIKNCNVRAVCFDFELLTKSVVAAENEAARLLAKEKHVDTVDNIKSIPAPDIRMVQEMANLLKIQLVGDTTTTSSTSTTTLAGIQLVKESDDDLTKRMGDCVPTVERNVPPSSLPKPLPLTDIRSKYAHKLNSRLDGGLSGVDSAKAALIVSLSKGDASGHLAARQLSIKQGSAATRWMSMTGTGSMLQLLSNRSMQIVLLPVPNNIDSEAEGNRMQQFTKQIPSVNIELLVKEGKNVDLVLERVLKELNMDSINVMLVSDRDDYIQFAKDRGMVTCRVRPPNARRGNITSHYTIENIPDTTDVVNEINGISFNAVLNR